MKQTIKLIIFLLFLVVGYAVYGLVAFQPDQPYEFVFHPPKLPPELVAEEEHQKQEETLSPEEIAKKNVAVRIIQDAIDQYQLYEQQLPQQASSTLAILNGYFFSGKLPTYFLGTVNSGTGMRKFGTLKFSQDHTVLAEANKKNISCTYQPDGTENLIGSEDDNVIECDSLGKNIGDGDRLILGGPGNDKITDTYGSRIVNGGSGDDTIALGPGRTIIVLDDGWGEDRLTVDCGGSTVADKEIPSTFPVPWIYKTTNFIVLSPRLDPNDLVWDGLTLRTKSGSDKLTVNENCFTIIPAKETSAAADMVTP